MPISADADSKLGSLWSPRDVMVQSRVVVTPFEERASLRDCPMHFGFGLFLVVLFDLCDKSAHMIHSARVHEIREALRFDLNVPVIDGMHAIRDGA